jgi:hypothetical protein
VDVPRPARALNLTAKLKDAANTSAPELSFQRKAVEDFHSRSAQLPQPTEKDQNAIVSTPDSLPPRVARPHSSAVTVARPTSSATTEVTEPTSQKKRSIPVITDDDSDDGTKQRMYSSNPKSTISS